MPPRRGALRSDDRHDQVISCLVGGNWHVEFADQLMERRMVGRSPGPRGKHHALDDQREALCSAEPGQGLGHDGATNFKRCRRSRGGRIENVYGSTSGNKGEVIDELTVGT